MCEKTIYCEYKPDDRRAIQKAIDSCPAGGKVVVPRGEWKSGPLTLKSNLTLEVAEDCVISFSDCMEDYLPPVFTRWEGVECYNYKSLIYARDCENITITGKGTFFWQRTELVALEKAAAAGCDCPLRGTEQGYPTGRAGVCHAGGCPAPVFSAADFL